MATAGGKGSIPSQGTKDSACRDTWPEKKKEKKNFSIY